MNVYATGVWNSLRNNNNTGENFGFQILNNEMIISEIVDQNAVEIAEELDECNDGYFVVVAHDWLFWVLIHYFQKCSHRLYFYKHFTTTTFE